MKKDTSILSDLKPQEIKALIGCLNPNHILRVLLTVDPENYKPIEMFLKKYASPAVKKIVKSDYDDLPLIANEPGVAQSPFYKWRFSIGR